MDRREFFRRSTLIAAGVVAADQLDLVERLGWKRRFFAGWSEPAAMRHVTFGTPGVSANVLDDYEEGWFVPRVSDSERRYVSELRYVRVGRHVQVFGVMTQHTAENVPRLMGLPSVEAPLIYRA